MIYVLRFDTTLGSDHPKGRARFYVGYAEPRRLALRIEEHQRGCGAAITRAAVKQGINVIPVAIFEGDRAMERAIKNYKNTRLWLKRHLENAVWTLEGATVWLS